MKLLIYIAIFNILGVVFSILYGVFGGSGGGTTTGVFFGVAFTGIITILFSVIFSFFQIEVFKLKWYWLLLLLIVGICEASLIDWKILLKL